jgi:hypothetical protein
MTSQAPVCRVQAKIELHGHLYLVDAKIGRWYPATQFEDVHGGDVHDVTFKSIDEDISRDLRMTREAIAAIIYDRSGWFRTQVRTALFDSLAAQAEQH